MSAFAPRDSPSTVVFVFLARRELTRTSMEQSPVRHAGSTPSSELFLQASRLRPRKVVCAVRGISESCEVSTNVPTSLVNAYLAQTEPLAAFQALCLRRCHCRPATGEAEANHQRSYSVTLRKLVPRTSRTTQHCLNFSMSMISVGEVTKGRFVISAETVTLRT